MKDDQQELLRVAKRESQNVQINGTGCIPCLQGITSYSTTVIGGKKTTKKSILHFLCEWNFSIISSILKKNVLGHLFDV